MANTHLNELRSHAGLLVQFLAAFPALILFAMGFGSGNFDAGMFLASLKTPEDHLLFMAMIGIPMLGILAGFFVKRGHRWAYLVSALLGVAACFIFFPFGAVLGAAVLVLLGRVCFYEFR